MTQKSKRVLILTTSYLPLVGGSEVAIKEVTNRLSDISFDIVTARLDSAWPSQESQANVSVHRVGWSRQLSFFGLSKILLPFAIFSRARSLLRKHDYDAVHVFQASQAAAAGWLLKLIYPDIFLILTLQEGKDLKRQGVFINLGRYAMLAMADRVTAISEYLARYARRAVSSARVSVIPNGVSITAFKVPSPQAGWPVIITVSRLVPKNGVERLVKAMAFIEEAELWVIGSGSMQSQLKELAQHSAPGRVVFKGSMSPQEIPNILSQASVFVRASHSEGLGNAFLEAMAAQVPVVGTAVGGIVDFLKDRETGLVTDGDPEDIAAKVNLLLRNDDLRERIVTDAYELVRKNYNWSNIAEKYRTIYDERA